MVRKVFITILASAMLFVSCRKEESMTEILLNLTEVTLSEGESVILNAAVNPSSAQVEWKSLDPSVARVQDGTVTAVSSGETYVLASVGEVNAGCLVTVIASVKGLSLNKDILYMSVGQTATVEAVVVPANALNPSVKWTSSDPSVAKVVAGTVTAMGNGEAEITAETEDGGYKETCMVYVMTMPEAMAVVPAVQTVNVGDVIQLTVEFEGADESTLTDVTWSSSDDDVATVDADGNVTAIGGGEVVITAVAVANGLTAEAVITVNVPLEGISLPESVSMYNGGRRQLECVFIPSDAANKNVIWSSDNQDVAVVTEDGVVFALSLGTATITAVAEDGGYTASCVVTVEAGIAPVDGVSLNMTRLSLVTGQYADLIATVSPSDAADKSVSWTSDDSEIAEVDSFGRVTAGSKAGVTTITVTTTDGGFTAKCVVTVVNFESGLPGYGEGDYEWND